MILMSQIFSFYYAFIIASHMLNTNMAIRSYVAFNLSLLLIVKKKQ